MLLVERSKFGLNEWLGRSMPPDCPARNSSAWEAAEAARIGPRGHELPGGKPAEATAGLPLTVAASHLLCPKPK